MRRLVRSPLRNSPRTCCRILPQLSCWESWNASSWSGRFYRNDYRSNRCCMPILLSLRSARRNIKYISHYYHNYRTNYNKILKVWSIFVPRRSTRSHWSWTWTAREWRSWERWNISSGDPCPPSSASVIFFFFFSHQKTLNKAIEEEVYRGDLKSGETNQSSAYDELAQSEQVYDPFQSVREPVNRLISTWNDFVISENIPRRSYICI